MGRINLACCTEGLSIARLFCALTVKLPRGATGPWRLCRIWCNDAGMAKPKIRDLPDLSDLARPGAEIAVRVTPKAARASLTRSNGALRAAVTAVPENGKANAAVRVILATALGIPPSRLQLLRGQIARDKVFTILDD